MGYYNGQGKFFAVNGIGTIQEITERLSKVIDNL
jgi:adenylate kinase